MNHTLGIPASNPLPEQNCDTPMARRGAKAREELESIYQSLCENLEAQGKTTELALLRFEEEGIDIPEEEKQAALAMQEDYGAGQFFESLIIEAEKMISDFAEEHK